MKLSGNAVQRSEDDPRRLLPDLGRWKAPSCRAWDNKRSARPWRTRALSQGGYLALVFIVVLIVGWFSSPYFMTTRNVTNIGVTGAVVSVLAVGEFFVIVTAGIDLSVGSTAALSSVVAALLMLHHVPSGAAIIAALAAGCAVGALNGTGVTVLKVTPFIVTLATLTIVAGIAYLIQVGTLVTISDSSFVSILNGSAGPVPLQVIYFCLIAIIGGWLMRYTAFGRRLYAIGGNSEAARLSGLPVKRDTFAAYVLSGLLAAFGGLLMAAQLSEGSAILGQNYELDAIAAAVVGGASLFGGTGDPISSVIGGLIIGMIEDIMDLRGVSAEAQLVVRGLVILLAVAFMGGGTSRLARKFRASRKRGNTVGGALSGTRQSRCDCA